MPASPHIGLLSYRVVFSDTCLLPTPVSSLDVRDAASDFIVLPFVVSGLPLASLLALGLIISFLPRLTSSPLSHAPY